MERLCWKTRGEVEMILTTKAFALGIYLTGILWYIKELIFEDDTTIAFVVIILGFIFLQISKSKEPQKK